MKVVRLPVTSMLINAYFYYDETTKDAVIIDPGGEGEKLNGFIRDNGLLIKAVLLTHGHFDHIGAVDEVRAYTNAPVLIHELEAGLMLDPLQNESAMIFRKPLAVRADKHLREGGQIQVGGGTLEVIFTPGHTPGGVSYYDRANHILFSGDTLFFESVGRADFSYADKDMLEHSIKDKLFTLPDDTQVNPGHGQTTSIGHEKLCNPFVNLNGRD